MEYGVAFHGCIAVIALADELKVQVMQTAKCKHFVKRDPPITTSMDNLGTKLKMIYEIKQNDLETSNFMNMMYLALCQFTKDIHQFC